MADDGQQISAANVVSVTDIEVNSDVIKAGVNTTANGKDVATADQGHDGVVARAESYWTTERDGAVRLRIGTTQFDDQAPTTVPTLFKSVVEKCPKEHSALAVKRNGVWQKWTYTEYYAACEVVAKAFIKLGLERFNSVGILGFNSPEWLFSYLGAIFAGGLGVGIYATNSPEACHFVAKNCFANIIVVENNAQLSKILQIWDQLPDLKAVIQYSGELEDKTNPNVYDWNGLMELGKSCDDKELNERINNLKANQCCSLIYTSGTTGEPKGVMLSHDNIIYTATRSIDFVGGKFGVEHVVSYLPLSHIAAQLADVFMVMIVAGTLWFAQPDALKGSLGETLKEVRPTIFLAVPRVWEKIMEKLLEVGRSTTGLKRRVANWAKDASLSGNMSIEMGQSPSFQFKVARFILKKVAVALGLDRCRHRATAAAPITMETLRYFHSINLPLYELYGMSECTGPQTVGKMNANLTGACGRTMEGMSLKIHEPDVDGNGEICMKGRHVFMGYLGKDEKTKEVLDDEGFLHSGDIGKVDENGFLFITGRIKELIITAGGENIAPVPIEDKVKAEVPLISNVMLVGDKRKFLSCLITLKVVMNLDTGAPTDKLTDCAMDYCKKHSSDVTTVSELLKRKDEQLMKAIQDGIDRYNATAASRAQKIQKWCILEHDFSIPGGELGPTMKMRRPIIHKMYAEKIDAFYK